MRAASRDALAGLRRRQSELVVGVSVQELTALAGDLSAAFELLAAQPLLRRTLGDPATAPDARAGLVAQLLGSQIGRPAVEIVQAAVRARWSTPWDLVDSLELAADDALFAAAEVAGSLDEVEDELFRFERILAAEPQLTTLLDESSVAAARRVGLLDQVLAGKVVPMTLTLLHHAISSARRHGIAPAVHDLLDRAAERRERSVARVLSPVELTDEQENRLVVILSDLYGRPITVRAALDRSLRGGLVIRVGDEIIDGSIASRVAGARTALAG